MLLSSLLSALLRVCWDGGGERRDDSQKGWHTNAVANLTAQGSHSAQVLLYLVVALEQISIL